MDERHGPNVRGAGSSPAWSTTLFPLGVTVAQAALDRLVHVRTVEREPLIYDILRTARPRRLD